MPFLYETLTPTYIVFDSDLSDEEAAKLIAKRKGFALLQTDEKKDPSISDPLYDENNLVCVGGWHANAYTSYYFPELEEGYDPETETLAPGPGVSEDGKRVVTSIIRPNGTTVTVIAGISGEDTLKSAYEYTKFDLRPIAVAGGVSAVALIAITRR